MIENLLPLPMPTEAIEAPPVPVALIDNYLANLGDRTLISVAEVRDLLLDVRNSLWVSTYIAVETV